MSSKPCTECASCERSDNDMNILWCTKSDSHIVDPYKGTCTRFKPKELQDGFYQ